MQKALKILTILILAVFTLGCSSGRNVVLDNAAIKKAQAKIKEMAKIIGSYKRLEEKLPPEDQPLFSVDLNDNGRIEPSEKGSLNDFITEKKIAEFIPSVENIYNQYYNKKVQKEVDNLEPKKIKKLVNKAQKDEELQKKYFEQIKETNSRLYEGEISEELKNDFKNEAEQKAIEFYKRQVAAKNITKKEEQKLRQQAKDLFNRKLPPFKTKVDEGGWKKPKWIIVKPKKEVVMKKRIEKFKDENGREPRAYRRRKIEDQVDAYIESQKKGYVIWMANDSNNTLVYAKVE